MEKRGEADIFFGKIVFTRLHWGSCPKSTKMLEHLVQRRTKMIRDVQLKTKEGVVHLVGPDLSSLLEPNATEAFDKVPECVQYVQYTTLATVTWWRNMNSFMVLL